MNSLSSSRRRRASIHLDCDHGFLVFALPERGAFVHVAPDDGGDRLA